MGGGGREGLVGGGGALRMLCGLEGGPICPGILLFGLN